MCARSSAHTPFSVASVFSTRLRVQVTRAIASGEDGFSAEMENIFALLNLDGSAYIRNATSVSLNDIHDVDAKVKGEIASGEHITAAMLAVTGERLSFSQ